MAAADSAPEGPSARIHYLDWLRFLARSWEAGIPIKLLALLLMSFTVTALAAWALSFAPSSGHASRSGARPIWRANACLEITRYRTPS